jgi:hypothetical protein
MALTKNLGLPIQTSWALMVVMVMGQWWRLNKSKLRSKSTKSQLNAKLSLKV